MKKYTILALAGILMTSCLDDAFLDREPLDELTEQSLFIEYNGFKTYNLSLYEELKGYSGGLGNLYGPDFDADNFFKTTSGSESDWVWHKLKVPTSGGGWDYSYIRKVNIMLDNIDKPNKLTEQEKLHLKSLGYFFRSYKYIELLSKFGDVVWIEHVINEKSEELYKPKDSRDIVANNILENLKFAEENINENGDGPNTINKDVVRALISRFCLFEGTWRKYHGLNDSEKYLRECMRVSKILTNSHPVLHANYDELFNSLNLKGVEGILLYRQYEKNIVTHSITGAHKGSKLGFEMTKDAVDSYLCSDGTPIYNQPDFPSKEQDPYTEFANRDTRLLYTVMPPYHISTGPAAFEKEWWHTDNPKDRTFFPIMERLSAPKFKALPIRQNGGSVCKLSPHFLKHNGGFAFQATQGGYMPYKYYNDHEPYPARNFTSDAPIFRMGEVLLNYAEAAYELGEINQEIIDQTINKLRDRGEVAHLNIDNIIPDVRRDPSVSPLLWEIRRERRVELMGEGFRFDDIRRWKKGEYANKHKLGRWYSAKQLVADGVIPSEDKCKINFINNGKLNNSAGYIVWEKDPVTEGYGWLEHYYLYPIPLNDLALNPQLVQNPGWEK